MQETEWSHKYNTEQKKPDIKDHISYDSRLYSSKRCKIAFYFVKSQESDFSWGYRMVTRKRHKGLSGQVLFLDPGSDDTYTFIF